MKKAIVLAALVGCVYGANYALERWGIVTVPLLSVTATAGVYFAGLTFMLRDLLHELGGRWWVFAAIVMGAGLSWWLSDAATIPGGHTSIAVASGTAFLLSELADMAVYSPLRRDHKTLGVALSQPVGAVADTCLFLWLAFGNLDTAGGQILVKTLLVLPVVVVMWAWRWRSSTITTQETYV